MTMHDVESVETIVNEDVHFEWVEKSQIENMETKKQEMHKSFWHWYHIAIDKVGNVTCMTLEDYSKKMPKL